MPAKPKTTASAKNDIFECTECRLKAHVALAAGPGLRFPLHCGQMMRMLDGHELNRFLRKITKETVLDVEEAADGSLVVEALAAEAE